MTSEAYVWVWLPGAEVPVPAGVVRTKGDRLEFHYGRHYLQRTDAIALYDPELPLIDEWIEPILDLEAPGCLADAAPDSWGRRVIESRLQRGSDLPLLDYLVNAGSDRIGALDFQASPTEYVPRGDETLNLEDIQAAAHHLMSGERVPAQLEAALQAGSSVGGARPKALLRDTGRSLIAKFSTPTDTQPVVRAEFLAMRLAARCGLDVAPVELTQAGGRDVLLVERFDRIPGTARRRLMVSALTTLGLPELALRDTSYAKLSERLLLLAADPTRDRRELFARILFNILCGNTDDHARNHAAFWDGERLALTPAYDICPYPRGGGEAKQAMAIGPRDNPYRFSNIAGCLPYAQLYGLKPDEAAEIAHRQIDTITTAWDDACDEARLTGTEREAYRRVIPSGYALQGL
ncbi:type II toxin-antitoxin system HipA family toxin [Miltoncostaea oceani]|uniref:type II toxin-antitoxin system HipA family toxin n=1 Tax=Miltoncostaea oceani TaxID=2843216 RepID=UPI001C3CF680|nr:type II toxin-antitoxin system HipA family toxin [Miltoncostaea oceani]